MLLKKSSHPLDMQHTYETSVIICSLGCGMYTVEELRSHYYFYCNYSVLLLAFSFFIELSYCILAHRHIISVVVVLVFP